MSLYKSRIKELVEENERLRNLLTKTLNEIVRLNKLRIKKK